MSNYHIKHLEEYYQVYRKSIREPENFWEEVAEEHFVWRKKWDDVLSWDFTKPEVKWFEGAKLNITENCIDRHLATRGDKTAILFEPNNPDEASEHITYSQLHKRVNQFANVLKITESMIGCICLQCDHPDHTILAEIVLVTNCSSSLLHLH